MTHFLPVTMQELLETGVSQPDFVYITGDAYVDHPSFGAAIITRLLESQGYSVAVLSQPDWHTVRDFQRFGKPRLAFLVTGGNIDSMVAHYTSAKRKRSSDMYSPGGKAGLRPDRAVITYCRKIRETYPDAAIAIGGLEASLRRFAHYDYWDDTVRPSILVDSGADLLMYGMGDKSIIDVARAMKNGFNAKLLRRLHPWHVLPHRAGKHPVGRCPVSGLCPGLPGQKGVCQGDPAAV